MSQFFLAEEGLRIRVRGSGVRGDRAVGSAAHLPGYMFPHRVAMSPVHDRGTVFAPLSHCKDQSREDECSRHGV